MTPTFSKDSTREYHKSGLCLKNIARLTINAKIKSPAHHVYLQVAALAFVDLHLHRHDPHHLSHHHHYHYQPGTSQSIRTYQLMIRGNTLRYSIPCNNQLIINFTDSCNSNAVDGKQNMYTNQHFNNAIFSIWVQMFQFSLQLEPFRTSTLSANLSQS